MSPASRGPDLLEVSRLSVRFDVERGIVRAVDDVSFRVAVGETLGIVGESGCGKTVTALALVGLSGGGRLSDESSVRLRGEELVGATATRLRQIRGNDIAMIFQEPTASLNPVLTVGDHIVESIRAHSDLGVREARAEAVRLLEEVGISDPAARVDEYPHRLSGGMAQRVMIAMALSCRPALLVADEPTTALDPTIQAQILALLARLRADREMAMLLISHDLSVIAQACDRVAVMYAGRIVETGEAKEVFSSPRHPYTRALLDAMPARGDDRGMRAIDGSVPSPIDWPSGCRFRPRCPLAFDRCGQEPDLLPLPGVDRAARCWLAERAPTDSSPGAAHGG